MQNEEEQVRPRGIYLLPNLLTTGGLFAGFYAIVAAMQNQFETAAIAIFVAMLADSLDGRVARLTNTESAFGVQYDSLSDMVSFGLAPALIIYRYSLMHLGKLGWLVAFSYAAAGALRLARFNTQVKNIDKRYFQGLPIPGGAGILASVIWLGTFSWFALYPVFLALLTFVTASLMISNIRYYSFKTIDLKGKIKFIHLVILTLIFVGIALSPPLALFLIFVGYGLSGPLMTLMHVRQKRLGRLQRKSKMVKPS